MKKTLRLSILLLSLAGGLVLLLHTGRPVPEPRQRLVALNSSLVGMDQSQIQAVIAPAGPVIPTTVRLSDVPTGVAQPAELAVPAEPEALSPEELAALDAAALALQPFAGLQDAAGATGRAPTPGVSFDSIDFSSGGGGVPPDPELAVGPNHVIAVVNVSLEVYDKSGNSLNGSPVGFSQFMASNPDCPPAGATIGLFDPNALYDEKSDRYYLGIDASGSHYCLAVSQTGDPMGSWWIYAFPTLGDSTANFFDYPHAGVGDEAMFMGGNMFFCLLNCAVGFPVESRVWAFKKSELLSGGPVTAVTQQVSTTNYTPQPLHLHGFQQGTWPAGPHYFMTAPFGDAQNGALYRWTDPFGSNSFALQASLSFGAGAGSTLTTGAPQQGGDNIQANDPRPQDFEYHNGFGWTSQVVSCNPGGGTVHCVRWAKIDLSAGTIADSGVYGSQDEHRLFPDLAVNRCGDMAIGYTKTSSSMYPSVFVTGRLASDLPGQLQAETLVKAGTHTYTAFDNPPHRWGDYTEMTIAPDGETFWYLGEYSRDSGATQARWANHISSFTFDGCGGPAIIRDEFVYLPVVSQP